MPKNLPPGPLGLPIVGYLPFMDKKPLKSFIKLGKKYGSIYSLYLGNKLIVVLNDYNAIKEAFVKQAETFIGRPEMGSFSVSKENNLAITTNDGPFWREHRRFTLAVLKEYGVGQLSMEPQIMDEIRHLIDKVKELDGKPSDIKNTFATSISNNICIMTLGKRFEYGDATFLKLKLLIDEFAVSLNTVSAFNFFTWLKYIPGIAHIIGHANVDRIFNDLHEFIWATVGEHKNQYTSDRRDNYIMAYFTEQQSRLAKNNTVGDFTDRALINNIRALFIAGTETTTSTLLWGIIYIMLHPKVQKKVQDELDRIIGSDRDPSWNDRFQTPYTEATICEVQRMARMVPLSLPHRNTAECQVLGYTIPKSTLIIPNLGNVLSDPQHWGDSQNFRPERFLSEDGKFEKPEYFIPFSIGKRECLGENLARMELYLYFTSLMLNFTFQSPDGMPPGTESLGAMGVPNRFVTCALLRKL